MLLALGGCGQTNESNTVFDVDRKSALKVERRA
jgi:hypothetical protein